jgi:hypothetical protein
MEAAVHIDHTAGDEIPVGDIPDNQFDAGQKVLALASGEVVEYSHAVPIRGQGLDQMGAYEAATAGN